MDTKLLVDIVNNMDTIMRRYNFRFNRIKYPIERIIELQRKLVVAYLHEYSPGVIFEVNIVFDESANDMYAVIKDELGESEAKLYLNNWRHVDD